MEEPSRKLYRTRACILEVCLHLIIHFNCIIIFDNFLTCHIILLRGVPWVLPSVLEQYQTALRDPAFYMIWKRVLHLFTLWQQKLPYYTHEELSLPGVKIEKVEVDKLVTYFEHTYMNVTNHLYLNEHESKYFDALSIISCADLITSI